VEEALRDSEQYFRTLFEQAGDSIYILDIEGKHIVNCNRQACSALGYSREEILQLSPTDIEDILTPEEIAATHRRLETEESPTIQSRHRRKDGTTFPVEIRFGRLDLAQQGFVIAAVLDVTKRKRAEEQLQQSWQKVRIMLEGTVGALASVAEKRDPYTAGHQQRVSRLACAIAEQMGLPEAQIEGIRVAGTLHDIGKMYVPAEILNKPGALANVEMALVRTHSEAGYDIVKGIEFPWPVAQAILQHHERFDGSGYPAGLSGEDIILEARVLSVADVVEAMSSPRPFRQALSKDEALEEISRNRGVLYDPRVVDACLKLFTEKGFRLEHGN